MAKGVRRLYWDTTCFLCFLSKEENKRRKICDDILRNAQNRNVILYTSTFTISEVVYPHRSTIPKPRKLTTQEIEKISGMFKWKWLKKVDLDQRVAFKAVELTRDCNLKPADAIHAASAILSGVDALQKWDRDFNKVAHLVNVEEPSVISQQVSFNGMLPRIGPSPDDFSSP